jgi:hypothetical protein
MVEAAKKLFKRRCPLFGGVCDHSGAGCPNRPICLKLKEQKHERTKRNVKEKKP